METLDDFYADERRQRSPEMRLGTAWQSSEDPGSVYSIFWLADTRELCALRSPRGDIKIGGGPTNMLAPGGMIWANTQGPARTDLSVSVLGLIDDEERLNMLFAEWADQEETPDGLDRIKQSLRS